MKVFVAGATGAIGRFAVPALRGAGHDVTAVARSDAKAQQLREQGATAVTASIFDREALVPLVAGHDAVVQIATHIPPARQAARASAWAENDRIRRQASAALTGAAADAGVGRYVQESITFTYPDRGDAWIDEDVPVDAPEALSSVLDAEAAARRFTGAGGTGVVLRFGALYGPGSEQTAMIARLARRHVGMVMGRAGGYVSVLHLADAGTAVVAALGVPAGTYNAVDEEPVTKGEMARIVGEAVGARPWVHLPGRLTPLVARGGPGALARSQRVSGAKLRDAAGWRPRYRSLRVAWLEDTGWLDRTGWGVGPAAPDGAPPSAASGAAGADAWSDVGPDAGAGAGVGADSGADRG